ncbi:sensor histidine kinase [Streptomyces sp. NPDC057623]|uniref:sensor histidine kinase n=1 Tax=Streptomyces sp. NPDC057623 TaxID=3346187 RepID=UPI00368BE0FF
MKRALRAVDDGGPLWAAALCAAIVLAVSGLWGCYLLAHLGAPGLAGSAQDLTHLLYALPAAAAGVVLHAHRPGIPAGWVLLVYSMSVVLPLAVAAPMWVSVTDPTAHVAAVLFRAVANVVKITLWYSLPLWFPDGRLPNRWWRLYLGAVALWVVPQVFINAAYEEKFGAPNPLASGWWGRTAGWLNDRLWTAHEVSDFLFIAIGSAVLAARILRDRTRRYRQALLPLAAYLLWAGAQYVHYRLGARYYWQTLAILVAASIVWSASVVYVAVRTGGWRISRSARRILAGLVAVTLLITADVAATAALATGVAPGRATLAVALVAPAFLLGAGLRPATAWAVGMIERLHYGERTQPYHVLRTLAERFSRAGSPQDIPATICTTVVETLRLPGAALAVHTRAGPRVLARAGCPDALEQHFDLVHHGASIGRLSVGTRDGEATLDAPDARILSSLAQQATPAVASLRLQEDLQTSREQLVTAREAERRRLRQDIHDGLGPALAGLRLRVDNAAAQLAAEDEVRTRLDEISQGLALAIEDVRRITDRLGAAPLGDCGLSGALRQLTASFDSSSLAVRIALDPLPLPPLPAAVEAAAYRITAEALNNVLRHARATSVEVQVRVDARSLTLEVHDDGVGIGSSEPPPTRDGTAGGVGLDSMADRAAEIGGRFTIGRTGRGTRVMAVLPRSLVPYGTSEHGSA